MNGEERREAAEEWTDHKVTGCGCTKSKHRSTFIAGCEAEAEDHDKIPQLAARPEPAPTCGECEHWDSHGSTSDAIRGNCPEVNAHRWRHDRQIACYRCTFAPRQPKPEPEPDERTCGTCKQFQWHEDGDGDFMKCCVAFTNKVFRVAADRPLGRFSCLYEPIVPEAKP